MGVEAADAKLMPESESRVDQVSLDEPAVILPVRHHSPGCAFQVGQVIRTVRPDAVLIEGPQDATALIELLLDAETTTPVAISCHLRREAGGTGRALFFPFCDYSPELEGLRAAREVGAEPAFIDLPSWWSAAALDESSHARVNGYADHELRHHGYIEELCRRSGVRSFDELWETLFETAAFEADPKRYFTSIATYCRAARAHAIDGSADGDRNRLREEFMAARIAEKVAAGARVIAIVGGYHRDGIRALLSGRIAEPRPPQAPRDGEHGVYLTLYGYQQLDRWQGYDAGMPAPAFFEHVWRNRPGSGASRPERSILAEVCQAVRRRGESITTADLIATSGMLEGLRRLRGHPRATLDDLRDALRSTWTKGATDAGAYRWQEVVEQTLTGDRIGSVTPRAGRPAIVDDFHQQLRALKLTRDRGQASLAHRREVRLSIYREPLHRRKSAFLHRLVELESPFAKLEAGPDFVLGRDVERVQEVWTIHWKPEVDALLVENALLGSSVKEAAARHLLDRARAENLHAEGATERLRSALLMDLADVADEFLPMVEAAIEREPDFAQAARAMAGLVLLVRYRTILGASRYPTIERMVGLAYRRAIWLMDTLAGLAPAAGSPTLGGRSPEEEAVDGLLLLRHASLSSHLPMVDADLFAGALEALRPKLGSAPIVLGAALGLLRQIGRISTSELAQALRSTLNNTRTGDSALGEFLRGVFACRRHAVIEETEFFRSIHDALSDLEEEQFLRSLPSLRLAFSEFTPRETGRIVERIDDCVSARTEPPADFSAQDRDLARRVDDRIRAAIEIILPPAFES